MEFLFGVVMGVIVTVLGFLRLQAGVLKIYVPEQEESPYLYVELDKPMSFICRKRYILFKTDTRDIDSQK